MYKLGFVISVLGCLALQQAAAEVVVDDPIHVEDYTEESLPTEEDFAPVPAPPDLPPPVQSGEPLEPEVTIIRRDDATIEEYRINNRLYMVKVTPVVGKPYYLIDRTGDGRMETRMSEIYDDYIVPQWVLFSW